MSINYTQWIHYINKEYLSFYIPSGGSSVRIAIGDSGTISSAIDSLIACFRSMNYHHVVINTENTRVQHVHNIYFEAARSIDWRNYANSYAMILLDKRCIAFSKESLDDIDQMASLNNREPRDMIREIKDIIYCDITTNYQFCREFRWFMTALVTSVFFPNDIRDTEIDNLISWATGNDCLIAPLKKRFLIFQRISKSNARHMLRSLSTFLGVIDKQGLAIVVDARSLFIKRSNTNRSDILYYTKSSIIDTYESIRCFIDDIDDFSNFALFVFCDTALTDGGRLSVQELYTALYSRIVNEVHGEKSDNPLNLLVSLSNGDHNND